MGVIPIGKPNEINPFSPTGWTLSQRLVALEKLNIKQDQHLQEEEVNESPKGMTRNKRCEPDDQN